MAVQQPYVQLNVEGIGTIYVSMVDGAEAGLDTMLAEIEGSALGMLCQMLEKTGEALEHGENYVAAGKVYGYCVRAVEKLNSPVNTALALNNQALAYKRGAHLELALETYARAAGLVRQPLSSPSEERERAGVLLPILMNLAILYFQRGERVEAADAATSALQIARTRTDAASRHVAAECSQVLRDLGL